MPARFSIRCKRCERLADYLAQSKRQYPSYYCKPVPPFGDPDARLLIVGLAPGLHGANATGRPFTGDHAGIILYETLHRFGFANRPESTAVNDGLRLHNCRITNAVKCVPPQNKPSTLEIKTCNEYLRYELQTLPAGSVVLALGRIAHDATLSALQLKKKEYVFAHGATHGLPDDLILQDSYHCSRYNTQTRRLTAQQFDAVFEKISKFLR